MSCASCVYLAFHLFIRPVSHAFVHFARSLFYLFVRPIFVCSIISLLSLCLFTRLLSLFVESLVPFFLFFYSLVSSLFLLPIRSFSLSFSLFLSPVRFLRSSPTRSFSPAFFGYLALLFNFLQSIFHCISHPFFFFFLSPTGRSLFLLVCWHAFSFATPSLFGFLTPSPLSFLSPSVLSSLPIFYFFVLNSQSNVSHFNPSKGCFIEKNFYKTVYSSYVVHGTTFRVFLSHLYCRRKETLHW